MEEVFFSIARDIKQRLAATDSRAEVYVLHALFFVNRNWTATFQKPYKFRLLTICGVSLQPATLKINQPDQAGGAGQAAQKSACCGS